MESWPQRAPLLYGQQGQGAGTDADSSGSIPREMVQEEVRRQVTEALDSQKQAMQQLLDENHRLRSEIAARPLRVEYQEPSFTGLPRSELEGAAPGHGVPGDNPDNVASSPGVLEGNPRNVASGHGVLEGNPRNVASGQGVLGGNPHNVASGHGVLGGNPHNVASGHGVLGGNPRNVASGHGVLGGNPDNVASGQGVLGGNPDNVALGHGVLGGNPDNVASGHGVLGGNPHQPGPGKPQPRSDDRFNYAEQNVPGEQRTGAFTDEDRRGHGGLRDHQLGTSGLRSSSFDRKSSPLGRLMRSSSPSAGLRGHRSSGLRASTSIREDRGNVALDGVGWGRTGLSAAVLPGDQDVWRL